MTKFALGSGKQKLEPDILKAADLLLADSRAQCERLGELQHAVDRSERAMEIGEFCQRRESAGSSGRI